MKELQSYFKENIFKQISLCFFIFLKAFLFIFKTMLGMFILNNVLKKDLRGTVFYIAIEFFVIILSAIIDYAYLVLREGYLENIKLSIINDLSHKIINQKNSKLKEKEKYISWLVNDMNSIKEEYFKNVYIFLYDVLIVLFTGSMILWFNVYIFIFNLIGFALMFKFSDKLSSKIETIQYDISKEKEKNVKYVTNLYENVYKFFFENKIKNFADKQNEYNNKYLKVYYNLNKKFHLVISELTILSVLIQILNASITTVYIINNKLPISAFFPICTFCAYFCNTINEIVGKYISLKNSKKVYEKYDNEIELEESYDKISDISIIEFKDVCLDGIINNFNLSLNKGDKCLIIGESGSGKSTIINLLLKNISNYSGEILINSKDIKNVDKYSIYSEIEYINSENFIFYSNIYDNVSIYDENCDKALVNSILNELEISTIDKEVKDDNLSLGQKQRLNLAKVFYNKKNIVILDEATSNLDEKNRYNIENKLINSDKTLILITHHYDDEYLKQFDKVIYLKKGEVVQYEDE